jgi:dTDP-4-dehydrorhamnose reductase
MCTPTYAGDLAEIIFEIVENKKYVSNSGIYHFSNEGFVRGLILQENRATRRTYLCDIQPCHSDEFPSPVKRPAYSVLDKLKSNQLLALKSLLGRLFKKMYDTDKACCGITV